MTVVMKSETYRHKITRHHNANVKNIWFKFRDLILRNLEMTSNMERYGKLAQKWDAPFRVIMVVKKHLPPLRYEKEKSPPHLAFTSS